MCRFNLKNDSRRIDPCMKNLINFIESRIANSKIVACCCGHGKYPMTIVIRTDCGDPKTGYFNFEIVSGQIIPRKKKFYKKDKQGYYFIPEIVNSKQEICNCGHKQWDDHKCTFEPMVAQECSVKCCKCKKFKPSSLIGDSK